MIIIGYQGIGKSTLGGTNNFIDLESGNFWIDGERWHDWYKPYCKIAEHLSAQGYDVFVSSHEVVRKQLKDSKEKVIVVCPSLELKDYWIEKLGKRWLKTNLDKDYKAYMNAKDRYTENIKELLSEGFECIKIEAKKYDLNWMLMMYKEGIEE